MDFQEIDILLTRYFNGETSLEEEALLRNFFEQNEVPSEYQEIKEMFRCFENKHIEETPPSGLQAELTELIEKEWQKENRKSFLPLVKWMTGAAAVIALTFGAVQFLSKPVPKTNDTYKNQQEAYLKTKEVLLLVSNTMNHKTSGLKYLSAVNKSFDGIDKVSEIDKIVNSVKNK